MIRVAVDRATLSSALTTIAPVARAPLAGFVTLTAFEGGLSLRAFNQRNQLECAVAADVEETGVVAVKADAFIPLVSALDKSYDRVMLVQDGSLKLSWGMLEATFQPSLSEGFLTPQVDQVVIADAANVRKAMTLTAKTIDKQRLDATVLFGAQGNNILAVTTDGHRLTEVVFGEKPEGFEITTGQAADLRTVATADLIEIGTGKHVVFTCGGKCSAWPRPVDKFPSYGKIFPTLTFTATLPTEEFRAAVQRVAVLDDFDKAVTITFTGFQNAQISNRAGNASEVVPCTESGPCDPITLNGHYLDDCLSVIETESTQLGVGTPKHPILVQPFGDLDYALRMVIMPMSVRR